MASAKARKILRRTLVGSSIAAAVALTFWGAHQVGSGWPILIVCSALLLATVWEVSRMGALAGRGLFWILFAPALGTVLATADAMRALRGGEPADRARWAEYATASLAHEYLWAIVLALIGFGILRAARGLGRARIAVELVIAAALCVWIWRLFVRPEVAPERQLQVFAAAALVVVYALARGAQTRRELALTVGLAAWMIVPLPALTKAWYLFGESGLIALLVLSKIGDNAAYFVGNAIGRHHPFPGISPGKTTEGCVASLIAGTLTGVGIVALGILPREPLGLAGGALAGAATNLAAQAGDLLESWVKRRAGVKDSGAWFGPSGGMLDLVDSLLLAVPVALFLWPRIFVFPGA